MKRPSSKSGVTALSEFKMYYEDVQSRPIRIIETIKRSKRGKSKQIRDMRKSVTVQLKRLNKRINKLVKKLRKKPAKTTVAERALARQQRNRAILGIGQLLVVVSIAYSTAVIYIGVDSISSRVALLPQATFALIILTQAFSKLYK